MKYTKNHVRSAFVLVSLAAITAASSASGTIIFQSGFDGILIGDSISGTTGGTARLPSSVHYTSSIVTPSSATWANGGFVRVSNPGTATNGISAAANFTPASAANSWAALHTGGDKATLNGGADFFVKFTEVASGVRTSAAWFRPLDIGAATSGGLRVITQNFSLTSHCCPASERRR
ncbi:MAG: hypothetical protein LBK99_03085 [Opitutaceae bacterium]|jgi:hypothetical protein|nr:hypothetical protein [Opitutaceae bacterium]